MNISFLIILCVFRKEEKDEESNHKNEVKEIKLSNRRLENEMKDIRAANLEMKTLLLELRSRLEEEKPIFI